MSIAEAYDFHVSQNFLNQAVISATSQLLYRWYYSILLSLRQAVSSKVLFSFYVTGMEHYAIS